MSSADIELLRNIQDEIIVLNQLNKIYQFDKIINDPFLSRTLERCLEIIGEASKKISPDFKSKYPVIPWREIGDTRNKLIHDYSGIDYEVIRKILFEDIPELEFQINNILKEKL